MTPPENSRVIVTDGIERLAMEGAELFQRTAVASVAREYRSGVEITDGLLNHVEVAIRAYDPCLSCSTHAVGHMPLDIRLINHEGHEVDRLVRDA